MKAVVMAGGFGTRIQPLTSSVPKPMIPVYNKPMMEYIIMSLRDAGIKDIAILLYFKPEIIKEHFGDGSKLGIHIEYFTPSLKALLRPGWKCWTFGGWTRKCLPFPH